MTTGNFWNFQVADNQTGLTSRAHLEITGSQIVNGAPAQVFTGTDPDQPAAAPATEFVVKDASGVTLVGIGSNPSTLTSQLLPYQVMNFPLSMGSSFVQLDCTNLDAGQDLDRDGRNELLDVRSVVTVAATETVALPFGSFTAVRLDTQGTLTIRGTMAGATATSEVTQRDWYAPGIGRVQNQITQTAGASTIVDQFAQLTSYSADGNSGGALASEASASAAGPPAHPALRLGPIHYLLPSARLRDD